jgi:hypothetical protein
MMSVFDNNITLDLSYSVSRDPWVFSQISVGVIRSDLLKPGGPPHLGPRVAATSRRRVISVVARRNPPSNERRKPLADI